DLSRRCHRGRHHDKQEQNGANGGERKNTHGISSWLSTVRFPGLCVGARVSDQARFRTSQSLAWNHPKVVIHGKDSRDRVGAETGEVLVCLAVDNSLKSYMAALDNDADW